MNCFSFPDFMKWFLCCVGFLAFGLPSLHAQIFADFETSLGDFTCELNYTAAPKTVANFVGLATGERKWIDPSTGVAKANSPYYDGLTFHRVIANFMNQSGSRNGLGTDGPGYVFPDETENGLTHQPYVISMANSGTYTNGSQFFITAVATSWLDGKHTVFGSVTSGRAVIDAINRIPTTNDRPNVPVVIQKVSIRRVGTAAKAFDATAQGLPELSNFSCDLDVAFPTHVNAISRTPRAGGSVTQVFSSSDLVSWTHTRTFSIGAGDAVSSPFVAHQPLGFATDIGPKGFFRFAGSVHSDALRPQSLGSRTLKIVWPGNNNTLTFTFNSAGTGGTLIYDALPEPRAILEIYDSSSPYDLILESEYFYPFKFSMAKTGDTPTHFTGTQKISQWVDSSWNYLGSGTVTLTK
jgi:peptidyl-prolyl cis-trans isomerase A (cyclophilin A)